MTANNETRVVRNNSVEEFRQKTNEISLNLGDNKLLDSRLGDKVFSYTASAGQTIFDDARIEFKTEETIDNTAGYIIFTGSPTIPASFVAGATITQVGGFSATIVSISQTKLLIKNSSGTFSASAKISIQSDEIAASKIVRIVAESYPKGLLTVTKNGTELVQDAVSVNGFHIPNYALKVNLTGSPTIPASFTEGATLTQSGGFSGTLLSADSTTLRFKTFTGTFSDTQNLGAPHTDASNRIASGSISSHLTKSSAFGTAIELNTPAAGSDAIVIKTTNLVDAVSEVQDDIGNIANLQTNNTGDITLAINELELGLRGTSNNLVATDLTNMTANNVVSAILEHEADIGDVTTIDDASGYSGTSVVTGITELQNHIGTKASLTTTDKTNLVAAINEVDANADASIKLTSSGSQTISSDITFGTSGKTLTFGSGTTLDMRSATLLTGGGAGSTLSFDTAFLNITPNTNVRGISFERSDHSLGSDVEIRFNELQVGASKQARAFQVKGLDDSGNSQVADLVTFYNAKELITSNTESGIAVDWDSTNQNFDFNVNDFTITLAGDLSGNVTITDLASATLTATVVANSVALGTDTTGDYVQTITGTSNEITVTGSGTESRDVTIALPDDVTIGQDLTVTRDAVVTRNLNVNGNTTLGNASSDTVSIPGDLTITGDLTVNGTNTTLNTTTLEVEDTLILTGTSTTEPTTGGFGIETRSFSGVGTHSNAASNVTGSHSLVYNFATDRWEADGSLVLSEATLNSPNVEQNGTNKGDLIGAASLDFKDGEGINPAITLVGGASGDFEVVMNLQEAASGEYGGVKIGYTENGRNYPIELDSGKAYVNVPWTDTVYTLPAATNTVRGGIELFTNTVNTEAGQAVTATSNRTYGLQVNSDGQGVVNVPWTDTVYTLPEATSSALGGIQIGYSTNASARNYAVQLDSSQAYVNVPWGSDLSTTQTTSSDLVQINSSDGTNAVIAVANSTDGSNGQAGVMSRAQVHKLNNIETSANNYKFQVDIAGNTFGSGTGTNNDVDNGERLVFAGGTDIQVALTNAGQGQANTITIKNNAPNVTTDLSTTTTTTQVNIVSSDGTDATIGEATGSAAGVMSVAMHDKLDTIATGAQPGTVTSVLAESSTWLNGTNLPNMGLEQTGTSTGNAVLRLAADARCNYVDQVFGNSSGEELTFNGTSSLLTFRINGTEEMRLDSSGNLHVDGNVVAFSSTVPSDERLKENIQVVDGALEKVSQLSGYTFNYKEDGKASAGLIAQEVEKVLPTAVEEQTLPLHSDDDTEYKTVEYDQVIALLVESVKELKAEIEELKKHK